MIQITQQTNINDFTEKDFIELMNNNSDEDLYFDFKSDIELTDPKKVHNIRKSAVSFANTFGGFLFFGILDIKNIEKKKGMDRIVGINKINELGQYFTQKYLGKELCIPMIHFEAPRILEVNGKKIAIFKFLPSKQKPHAVRKQIDNLLEFWARGSGTARPMNYQDLITDMESSREQRGWLNSIFIDLDALIMQCKDYKKHAETPSIPDLIWSIFLTNYGDVLRIIVQDVGLSNNIYEIKRLIEKMNSVIDHVRRRGVTQARDNLRVTEEHNKDIGNCAEELMGLCEKAQKNLTEKYPTIRELILIYSDKNI